MNFAFDERQREFAAQVRGLGEKLCTPAELRRSSEEPQGWSSERWRCLAELGVLSITVPDTYGGLGLDEIDLVLVLEELGRSGFPEPVAETCALAVPLLAELTGAVDSASEGVVRALKEKWLALIAQGDAVLTVGRSAAPSVAGAQGAHLAFIERAGDLYAVELDRATSVPHADLDPSRAVARVDFDPKEHLLIASGPAAHQVMQKCSVRAATAFGALLVGICDRLLQMASRYAADRVQFGKPIGSFQAVKHHLANARVRLEFARPAVYAAAWAIANNHLDAPKYASMAKSLSSDAATMAAGTALQVHGAIGYTWESELHLWMKRAWALSAAWGNARYHRRQVMPLMLQSVP